MGLTALKPLIGLQASKQHEELLDVLSARSCRDQQPWFECRDKKKKKRKGSFSKWIHLKLFDCISLRFYGCCRGLNFWRWRVKYYSPSRNWRETKRTSSRYCLLSKFSRSPFISLCMSYIQLIIHLNARESGRIQAFPLTPNNCQ